MSIPSQSKQSHKLLSFGSSLENGEFVQLYPSKFEARSFMLVKCSYCRGNSFTVCPLWPNHLHLFPTELLGQTDHFFCSKVQRHLPERWSDKEGTFFGPKEDSQPIVPLGKSKPLVFCCCGPKSPKPIFRGNWEGHFNPWAHRNHPQIWTFALSSELGFIAVIPAFCCLSNLWPRPFSRFRNERLVNLV